MPSPQLGNHLLAGSLLTLLGVVLAVALAIGLRTTTRGAHLEDGEAVQERRPALTG